MTTKPKPPPSKPDDPEQSKRFEDMAREVEADESGKDFQRAIKTVVPPKTHGSTSNDEARER